MTTLALLSSERPHIDVSLSVGRLRVWSPDDEAKALYKGAIVAAIHANQLVARRNAEVLPAHARRLLSVIVELVPELVDHEVASIVDETNALNVTTLAILADVNVIEAAMAIYLMPLIVLLSCITRTHVRTRYLIGKMQANAVQIRRGTKLNPAKPDLLCQVKLVELAHGWPLELVLIDWSESLHFLEHRHPEILLLRLRVDNTGRVCRDRGSHHRLGTILESLASSKGISSPLPASLAAFRLLLLLLSKTLIVE